GNGRLREKYIERRKIGGFGNCWAMVERITHAIPWLGWLRWPKTIRAGRWGCVGDTFENSHAFNRPAAHLALAGSDNGVHCVPPSLGNNSGAEKLYRKYTIKLGHRVVFAASCSLLLSLKLFLF